MSRQAIHFNLYSLTVPSHPAQPSLGVHHIFYFYFLTFREPKCLTAVIKN